MVPKRQQCRSCKEQGICRIGKTSSVLPVPGASTERGQTHLVTFDVAGAPIPSKYGQVLLSPRLATPTGNASI
eukprot:5960314-Karenia_brevis.AAC.1